MKQKIALKFCNGLTLPEFELGKEPSGHSLSVIAEMMQYGYMPGANLTAQLEQLSVENLASLKLEVIPLLKESVGAHVKHKPFYPNFPDQVMEMEEQTLFTNALCHYYTTGKWTPNFTVNKRATDFESVKFKMLDVITETAIDKVFTQILSSADSISGVSKDVVEWFIDSGRSLEFPDAIPFKENICLVAGVLLKNDKWNSGLVKDTTDILRIATYLSDGDISLAENTRFKSLPRKIRKVLIYDLQRVAKEEDFVMHKQKWVKLFHNLHVGEYSNKLYGIAKKLRENIKIETFNGKLEEVMYVADIPACLKMLKTRPGIFARKIIDLLYKDIRNTDIIDAFATVVDKVPARNLTQLWGAVKTRDDVVEKRVVFPKGNVQRAYVLRNQLARLVPSMRTKLLKVITDSLEHRFGLLEELGNVYIDPALYECPLPTGMRSASESLKEVARGTRLPFGNKGTLRFFIYWKGEDIDLSATFHDEEFNQVERISYTNLRGSGYKAAHSGDIMSAPDGASEFIDVDIDSVLQCSKGIRYVAMNVLVYSGPTFAEHEICFAGWMTRNKVSSNEIFEPKTVQQKVDLRNASKKVMPVIFDLKERKAIWTDISIGGKSFTSVHSNNVENNKASIQDMIEAFTSLDNKITLGELFEVHGKARGVIVENQEDADTVFSIDEGVTPYDVTTINADYL